ELRVGTGLAQAVLTVGLAVKAFRAHPSVWVIFVMAVCLASASSLQRPSREALLPRTVAHDELPAANALSSLAMQAGVLVGPAIGGLLVAYVGIGECLLIHIARVSGASVLVALVRASPPRPENPPPPLQGLPHGPPHA